MVYQAVLNFFPATFEGLVKRSCKVEQVGGGFWYGEVRYEWPEGVPLVGQGGPGSPPPPDSSGTPSETTALGVEFGFDTSGGTAHITQCIREVSTVTLAGVAAVDQKKIIGWDEDGKINGLDIVGGGLEFTVTRQVAFVTLKYIAALTFLRGKVNSATFLHRLAGELLFMGASGQYRDNGWTVMYKFAAALNSSDDEEDEARYDADSRDVRGDGTLIIPATKKGWQHVDILYRDEPSGNRTLRRPFQIIVQDVYEEADFANYLGWGA